MSDPIRIRATHPKTGSVTYLYRNRSDLWMCADLSGTHLSWSYAGIGNQTECRFALEDIDTPQEALAVIDQFASRYQSGEDDGQTVYTYELLNPVPAPQGGVYLRLFHGRKDPSEQLEDWGTDGPAIGPLNYVHTTYMCDVKFAASREVMEKFFPYVLRDWEQRGVSNGDAKIIDWSFSIVDGMIHYDGFYYGDWSVTS